MRCNQLVVFWEKVIDMECRLCGKIIEPTKKTLLREIVYKKGERHTANSIGNTFNESYGFLGLNMRWRHTHIKYTVEAKKDLKNYYFICPICNTKTYLRHATKPNYFEDDWKVIKKEEIIEEI